ncbi:uncharacterized protein LOC128996592 [Macrosteles quadrilineatus]|uniref:uncharacterized protein LOC128996592 n=1 Tax=Macrosteles quadrilineatus TaxID=74068 RepID=UPI0023E1A66B|nr:uncharacterized protein LOC128996592 [Macrosteles quadrilineatus]
MNKLNKIYTSARAFSLATKHVKTPPINLEMALVKGSKDISALVDLYSNTYMKEEPMVRAAGITDLRELTSFVSTALESQHSVLLRERSSGEVVAAASGGPVTSDTHEHLRLYAGGVQQ